MHQMMGSHTIPSLAILKVNWETERKDYLESFVPFVAQCIRSLQPPIVSTSTLQPKLLDDFGLQIPQNALKLILTRTAKRGYIRREGDVFVPCHDALNHLDFEPRRDRVLREHNALVSKFLQFSHDKHSAQFSPQRGEEILLSYLTQHDVELLIHSVTGTRPPRTARTPTRDHYLINSFVHHLHTADPEGFDYLDTIVKGHMLANALIFPHLIDVHKRFHKVTVYCDTAVLLRSLGYEGPAAQAPCKELLDLAYELGAHIGCFRKTRDEVYNILYACARALASQTPGLPSGYGPAFQHFTHAGYTQLDIHLELDKLDRKIEALGINICDTPERCATVQIDESALGQALQQAVRYGPERATAREHDVACISAVQTLRKGHSYHEIEDSVALFVTSNARLWRSTHRFFTTHHYTMPDAVPPAITDYLLTTILWLKRPTSAPDLPRKYIIAQSYAAMQPGENLWSKYLDQISSLSNRGDISPDDYYLLRASPQARSELMDLTMGDEDAIVEGTTQEILERIKRDIRAEESTKIEQQRKRIDRIESELHSERAKTRERQDSVNLRITGLSRRLAWLLSKALGWAVVVLLLVGAGASLPATLPPFPPHWPHHVPTIILGILSVLTILDLVHGVRLKDYLNRLEVFLAKRIEQKLSAWLSL